MEKDPPVNRTVQQTTCERTWNIRMDGPLLEFILLQVVQRNKVKFETVKQTTCERNYCNFFTTFGTCKTKEAPHSHNTEMQTK